MEGEKAGSRMGANGRELFYVQNVETDYAQPGSGRQARKLDELKRLVPAK